MKLLNLNQDIISKFDQWMVSQYIIRKGFNERFEPEIESEENVLKEKKLENNYLRGWLLIQVFISCFAVRALIMLMLPILPLKLQHPLVLKWAPIVCGDHIYTLGIPMRQMWFSLVFYYSIVCFALRIIFKQLDKENNLSFVTDFGFLNTKFASQKLSVSKEDVKILRNKAWFCYYVYYAFAVCIYSTVFGNLTISWFLQIHQTMSLIRAMTGLFWMIYHMYWLLIVVPIHCQVLFFLYMSCQVIGMRFDRFIEKCNARLTSNEGDKKVNIFKSVIECIRILRDHDQTCFKVSEYNMQMKMMLWYIYHIFCPTAATACYVLFTGNFTNKLSFYLVLFMSIGQLFLIISYLFFSRTIAWYSTSCFIRLFSIQCRQGIEYPVKLQLMVKKRIKHLTNKKWPVALTIGNNFPVTSHVCMEFMFNILTFVIMMLEAIVNMDLKITQ